MSETDIDYLISPNPKQTQSTNKFSLSSLYDKQLTFRREYAVVQKIWDLEIQRPSFSHKMKILISLGSMF